MIDNNNIIIHQKYVNNDLTLNKPIFEKVKLAYELINKILRSILILSKTYLLLCNSYNLTISILAFVSMLKCVYIKAKINHFILSDYNKKRQVYV